MKERREGRVKRESKEEERRRVERGGRGGGREEEEERRKRRGRERERGVGGSVKGRSQLTTSMKAASLEIGIVV